MFKEIQKTSKLNNNYFDKKYVTVTYHFYIFIRNLKRIMIVYVK